jgi:tRNA pseudouridine55 synthase
LELEPRKIHIYAIRFVNWAPPEATLEITCSGGTYIRSLAHDLGQALGVGAHLSALARTASGSFDLEHAVPLQELLDAFASGGWHDYLVPMDVALATYPACQLDGETASQVKHGQQVELANQPVDAAPESLCRAYEAGRFIAILRFVPEAGRWQPTKVFAD